MNELAAQHDPKQAHEAGYSDAYYDGLCLPEFLPCQCDECWNEYDKGQAEAIMDISKLLERGQS